MNYYLRFTTDAAADMARGFSYDILEESEIEMLIEEHSLSSRSELVGIALYGKPIIAVEGDYATVCGDGGLCGHLLESGEITAAIAEVRANNGNWYMDADINEWVIFAGQSCGNLVYDDGDCFTPESIVHGGGE